jgi:hypothetical protein
MQSTGKHTWKALMDVSYCIGGASCGVASLTESTTWKVDGTRLLLDGLNPSTADDQGPRPWEIDQLTVKVGSRAVVASSKANVKRLAGAVTVADAAARIADQFAKWSTPPARYVIFIASLADWRRWYGMSQPAWAAAYTLHVSPTVSEIVIRSDVVAQADLPVLLTHEMTHVTSLAGKRFGEGSGTWWLIEGIAEYASHLNVPLSHYDAVVSTRNYVRSGWSGDPAVSPPGRTASQTEAAGKYGIAFLSVRRLAEKYGLDKMLDFWGLMVHEDYTIDTAAHDALGVSWVTAKKDLSTYIKGQVAHL